MGAPYTFEAEKMVETGDFFGISGFAHFNLKLFGNYLTKPVCKNSK